MPSTENNSDFFIQVNRGGLKAPSDGIYCICCRAYQLFCATKNNAALFDKFLRSPNPRSSFTNALMKQLSSGEFMCQDGHNCHCFVSRIVKSFFNTIARNFLRSVRHGKDISSGK